MVAYDAELEGLPREELVERARALETVLRIAEQVALGGGVEDVAERFVEAVAAYTRFPSVVVMRYLPEPDGFAIVAQRGFDESKFPPRKILPANGSLTGVAAALRETVTTDDIATDERVEPETRAALANNAYTNGQVIQNLVLNACQASANGGAVSVCACRVAPPGEGTHVEIQVQDQGCGIAPEHLARVFEPFFTAREGGTGLGLAVSDSVVRRHGGRLTVASKLGRGTSGAWEGPTSRRSCVVSRPAYAWSSPADTPTLRPAPA